MKKSPRSRNGGFLVFWNGEQHEQPRRGIAQMHDTTNPTRLNPPAVTADEIRLATVHCLQSRLLLLRATSDTSLDPRQARELRDLAGILHHVICAIEELGR